MSILLSPTYNSPSACRRSPVQRRCLLFNPCITVSLVLLGILPPFRGLLYVIAQLMGSVLASALLLGLTGTLSVKCDIHCSKYHMVLQHFTPARHFRHSGRVHHLCSRHPVLMLAAEKHQATAFTPIGFGLTLLSCHLFVTLYTGASMNTARSFGLALVSGFPTPNHWVYWVGPFLDSILGSTFYALCKHSKYWTLNPHQDTDDHTKSPDNPVSFAQTIIEDRNIILDPRALVGQMSNDSRSSVFPHWVFGDRAEILKTQFACSLKCKKIELTSRGKGGELSLEQVS
ncbi:aquaporin-like protein [Mycena olivaceomarginata]|nr:aquaporin-like protein [Mycena olivaceomarginata]